jgi:hypothetical protein
MKYILMLIVVIQIGFVFGQDFVYPILIKESTYINDFIPNNWTLLDSVTGDLNKDNYRDIVMVFQQKDSISWIDDEADTLFTQPRILAILFWDNSKKTFKLIEQSNSFILNHDNPTMEDPFVGLSIDKNVLNIELKLWYNGGTWWTTGAIYKFRYNQNNDFDLIGFDSWNIHRATLETNDYSVNFLSKKYSITTEKTINNKTESSTKWKSFKLNKIKTLKTIEKPFNWEFESNITL